MLSLRAALLGLAMASLALGDPAAQAPVPSPARTVPVDLELVLAVDVSRSIDADEVRLQREGNPQATASPAVIDAIQRGPLGAIAVAYVEWSGADQQRTAVEWTLIRDA